MHFEPDTEWCANPTPACHVVASRRWKASWKLARLRRVERGAREGETLKWRARPSLVALFGFQPESGIVRCAWEGEKLKGLSGSCRITKGSGDRFPDVHSKRIRCHAASGIGRWSSENKISPCSRKPSEFPSANGASTGSRKLPARESTLLAKAFGVRNSEFPSVRFASIPSDGSVGGTGADFGGAGFTGASPDVVTPPDAG